MLSREWYQINGYRKGIERLSKRLLESHRGSRVPLCPIATTTCFRRLLFCVFLSFFSFSLYRFFLSLLLLFHAIVSLYRVVVVFVFLRLPLPSTLFVIRFRRLTLITLNRR